HVWVQRVHALVLSDAYFLCDVGLLSVRREVCSSASVAGIYFLVSLNEVDAAALAGAGGVGFRILIDVVPLAAAVDGGTFQREFQRVAVDLLQQRTAHAVAPDVLRPAFASQLRGNVLNGVEVDAIALDETHAR